MIATKSKRFEDIKGFIEKYHNIFITGCGDCSVVCKTGGEPEVAAMKEALEKLGKKVTGTVVIDPSCHLVEVKKAYQQNKEAVLNCDAILVMGCGDGVRTILEGMKKPVYPALDTIFLGETVRGGHFKETCSLCGYCVLDQTGGICPFTCCAKALLNGPCGGQSKGKCEVNKEKDCGWIMLYNRLKEINELDKLKETKQAKDCSILIKPRELVVEGATTTVKVGAR